MQLVPIVALPNQNFSIVLDNNLYGITLKNTLGCMSASITRNNVDIIDNVRCVAGTPLLPYLYLEDGNFIFVTAQFQLPDYTKFNVTQSLIYLSQAEITAFRSLPKPQFNPIAPLPLRYKPTGYVQAGGG